MTASARCSAATDLALPFYGANRPRANVSQGILDMFWLWGMQVGI